MDHATSRSAGDSMSARMLKFKFHANDSGTVRSVAMPAGSIIRAVGVQQEGEACVWVESPDDTGLRDLRKFLVVPTGDSVPDPGVYLGTVSDDPFVWHIYDVTTE